jgi:6-phosphofructokinase
VPAQVVIAQAGGPTPVINNSLRGVIDACRAYPDRCGRIFAARHGIEGVLREELLDLSAQDARELERLKHTPAAGAIGTCRYKLGATFDEDLERIIAVFRAHGVGYFFYIGGNDSMATAERVSRLARERGLDLVATGVPKTIDNDVGDAALHSVDHTPGYGSTARYLAHYVRNAEEENRGSCPADPVLVVQVMGRHVGFIPAAARLADPRRELPLRIFMAEAGLTLPEVADRIDACVAKRGRCIAIVSEGLDVGDIGAARDAFGHTAYGASRASVAQVLTNCLNERGLPVPGQARYQLPGTDQRASAIHAATVDLDEAYAVGRHCVEIALRDGTGWMGTIIRAAQTPYRAAYDQVPLTEVAAAERRFPSDWLSPSRDDVTDAFVAYARPLIGDDWPVVPLENGLPRYARLAPVLAEQRLPAYVPQGRRR